MAEKANDLDAMSLDDLEYTVLVDNPSSILVVDDEEVIRLVFETMFDRSAYQAGYAESGEKALDMIQDGRFALLIVDKNLPGISGLDVIRRAREQNPDTESIVMTGFASYESAVEALRLGAFDYLEKPFSDLDIVQQKIERALDKQRLAHENTVLARHLRAAHKDFRQTMEVLNKADRDHASTDDAEKRLHAIRQSIMNSAQALQAAYSRFMALASNRLIPAGPQQEIQELLEQSWFHLTEPMPQLRSRLNS
ncbi:MAG: response regulator [Deltaproteobacteria bacterium]|nr:response regulator [Deltaproteobacteria bacterium]